MRRIFVLSLFIVISIIGYAQKAKTIEKSNVCDSPQKEYGNIEPVVEFKNTLKAIIKIDKITVGTETKKVNLFKKINGCWEDAGWNNNWVKFNLGKFLSGYGYGNVGTSGYIGFLGSLTLE